MLKKGWKKSLVLMSVGTSLFYACYCPGSKALGILGWGPLLSVFSGSMFSPRAFLVAGLIAVLGVPSAGQAQSIKLGFHAGGHAASLRGATNSLLLTGPGGSDSEGQADWDPRTGFQAGAVLQIELSDWIVVQPELNYVQKGGTTTATLVSDVDVDQTTRYDYLELPVLAKLRIPVRGGLEPALLVGPSVGLNVQAESEAVVQTPFGGGNGEALRESFTVPETEFGAVFGGEVAYVFPSGNALSLEVRYSRGFTDVGPSDPSPLDDRGDEEAVRTEGVSLGIGYVVAL